jgi:NADPH:quinone reductase-like Zn-dependent oxidoreductase
MRAIIIKQFGGLDSLVIENLPDPVPQPGSVLIEVKAFGINHAETQMRKGECRLAFFDSTIFARHTKRWNPIKPTVKWWFASEAV